MAKTTNEMQSPSGEQPQSFPVSLTLEAFRAAVVDVFLHYIRTIAWMTTEKTAWSIVSLPIPAASETIFDPDVGAAELGFTYEHIRHAQFVSAMEHLYAFAFLGRLDESAQPMAYESYYMWAADIVSDAASGYVALEWDSYGASICASARKCVLVSELANARNMLEGGESFFDGFRSTSSKDKDNAVGDDSLNIRQMALLAGMEEMSIRAAANPKRANPLQTHDHDGGTRIAFDVAKVWLQSKGRYVPITRYWSAGEVDLDKRRFTSPDALVDALDARREMITARDGTQILNGRIAALGIAIEKSADRNYMDLDAPKLTDESLLRNLAELLELPADLLVLRTRETLAIQQLSQIERQLREATVVTTKTNN